MKLRQRWLPLAALLLAACTTGPGPSPTSSSPTPTASPAASPSASPTATPLPSPTGTGQSPSPSALPPTPPSGVARDCDYRPGNAVATMPAGVDVPADNPDLPLPDNTATPPGERQRQLEILESLADTVPGNYFHPDLNGVDWPARVAAYRDLVELGYTDDDLEIVLSRLVGELGDEHSFVLSRESIVEQQQQLAGQNDYVGIGIYALPVPAAGRATVLTVFAGSPAEAAGIRAHDSLLTVGGEPILNTDGSINLNLRGLPGTVAELTVERPGEAPRALSITRAPISGALPILACLVPGTGIAYLMVPCLCDLTIPDQMRDALADMAATTELTGVVLDNRVNGGGDERALRGILELFVDGNVGAFEGNAGDRPFDLAGDDVVGSQQLPVVVLVGALTESYGEVMSGVLQASDRSTVIGSTTGGNVETLFSYELAHGWELWLATEAFASSDADYGPWEETGIVPDIVVASRWDLFSEASDPALGAAVEALLGNP